MHPCGFLLLFFVVSDGSHLTLRFRLREYGHKVSLFLTGRLVLDPDGDFRRYWDIIVVLCVLYNMITAPWFIAFSPSLALTWLPADVVLLVLMSIDMIFVFRSGFFALGGMVVFDSREVASRYMRSSKFTLDLLSVLPFEFLAWALPNSIHGDERFTVGFWFSAIKVKQLLRAHKLLDNPRLDEHFQTPRLRVVKIFVGWALMGHFFACLLVFVGANQEGGETYNWMVASGLDYQTSMRTELYIAALYWSFTTMTSVGCLGWPFSTATEQAVVMVVLIASLAFYAAVFSSIGASLESLQGQARLYQSRMDSAKEYAAVNDLPTALAQKMAHYEDHKWAQTRGFDTDTMMHGMPLSVQSEVMRCIHKPLLSSVPFFASCSPRFLDALILRLQPAMSLLPGDYIFREGDTTRELYFLREGAVEIIMDNPITQQEEVISTLTPAARVPPHHRRAHFFGEVALLLGVPRTCSVKAVAPTVCNALTAADFFDLLDMCPGEEMPLREAAANTLFADFERAKATADRRQVGGTAAAQRATDRAVRVFGDLIRTRVARLEEGRLGLEIVEEEFFADGSPSYQGSPVALTPTAGDASPVAITLESDPTAPPTAWLPAPAAEPTTSAGDRHAALLPRRGTDTDASALAHLVRDSDESSPVPAVVAPSTPLPGMLEEESKEQLPVVHAPKPTRASSSLLLVPTATDVPIKRLSARGTRAAEALERARNLAPPVSYPHSRSTSGAGGNDAPSAHLRLSLSAAWDGDPTAAGIASRRSWRADGSDLPGSNHSSPHGSGIAPFQRRSTVSSHGADSHRADLLARLTGHSTRDLIAETVARERNDLDVAEGDANTNNAAAATNGAAITSPSNSTPPAATATKRSGSLARYGSSNSPLLPMSRLAASPVMSRASLPASPPLMSQPNSPQLSSLLDVDLAALRARRDTTLRRGTADALDLDAPVLLSPPSRHRSPSPLPRAEKGGLLDNIKQHLRTSAADAKESQLHRSPATVSPPTTAPPPPRRDARTRTNANRVAPNTTKRPPHRT